MNQVETLLERLRYHRSSMLSFIEIGTLLSVAYLYSLDREGR